MKPRLRKLLTWLAVLFPLFALATVAAVLLFQAQGGRSALRVPQEAVLALASDPHTVARGEYLARIGNCVTCHTARAGTPYAGGRVFPSKYGTLYSTNLTPHVGTGIGDWSVEEFRHAMRHGVSRTGLLYPAFPFANFNRLTDSDIDALFARLRSLAPVDAGDKRNALEFPASSRGALLFWRMLFHRPQTFVADATQSPAWNRGRYLVDGVGHCAMCHGERGSMAALVDGRELAGTRIVGLDWHAPALDSESLQRYSIDDLAAYLRHGVSRQGSAYGPMAEVISASLRHLTPEDALAIAAYLKSVAVAPDMTSSTLRAMRDANAARLQTGADAKRLYTEHCAECHQEDGRGRGLDYPPLAGNPLVVGDDAVNPIRIVLSGGIAPTTAGNPQPYSMPPFAQKLDDAQIADVINYMRSSWGNDGSAVTRDQVGALRGSTLD